jgi:hypothetical protein
MNQVLFQILANVKIISEKQAEILAKLNGTTYGQELTKITHQINELEKQFNGTN